MSCIECQNPTTITPEEMEVCCTCGLLQHGLMPIISMEAEKYISARADYSYTDDDFVGGSWISFSGADTQTITLIHQQHNQQRSSKAVRVSRFVSELQAFCYSSFTENISNEAIKILKICEKLKQTRSISKYPLFGGCIYIACQNCG